MKILIDIYHIPQYNFFRHTIQSLNSKQVDLCCIRRGQLVEIIRKECPGYRLIILRDYKHNKGKYSMLFKIIIPRFIDLLKLIQKERYDLILTAHYQANLAAKILGKPNIAFIDDPRKIAFTIDKISANELFIPCFENGISKTKKFNALKEWAYLSPRYFKANISSLDLYSLKPKEYIFIREVDTKTSNYLNQKQDIILSLANRLNEFKEKVVLSLEIKENKAKYPDEWIILEEPVPDIHSLLFYSKLIISSGDSMAREGGMLGIPSIYCGIREMPANDVLIAKNILFKVAPENLIESCRKIISEHQSMEQQVAFRETLAGEWEDVTELIRNKINQYT